MAGAPGGVVPQPADAEINPELGVEAAAPPAEPAGRKLIVLSDGTGNSERSPFKTNVWRTYQALHLWSGDQIARYDNGIGTSRLRPLAVIGSAFGWGLKRNVLELYKFLCREYRAGDEIFGFGFSRGAFTIRVLMGLIQHQGLVRYRAAPDDPPLSEGSLARYAAAAYRTYRKEHFNAWLTAPARWLRDLAIPLREKLFDIPAYDPEQNVPVASINIRFLGLWDTVDAYGMPIRELKRAVDIAIWPMTFRNLELGDNVKRACHALALDDERATFHPLLWDELAEEDKVDQQRVERGRIKQVWFAGMHANVGGGYPDDALAHVPLLWIITEAHDAGLRFHHDLLRLYAEAANPRGRIYDSRAGFATFYRYSPRRTDQSANDLPYARRALIHHTALDRVKAGLYAPISIRGLFEKERGGTATAESYNTEAMALVFDTVWWRRTAYWALVAIAAVLALFPWLGWLWDALGLDDSSGQASVAAAAVNVGASTLLTSTPLLSLVKAVTPAFAGRWLDSFARYPMPFSLVLFLGVCTLVWGAHLRDRAADRAREAWRLAAEEDLSRADFLRGITTRRNPTMRALLLLAGAVLAADVYLQPESSGLLIKLLPAVPILYAFGERLSARTTANVRMAAYLPAGPALVVARQFRENRAARAVERFTVNRLIPWSFVAMIALVSFWSVNAVGFAVLNAYGTVCVPSSAPAPLKTVGETRRVEFDIRDPCLATGIKLIGGSEYRITLSNAKDWRDGGIDLARLPNEIVVDGERRPRLPTDGYGTFEPGVPWWSMSFGIPMRRLLTENWLRPIARTGRHGDEEQPLGAHSTRLKPQTTGELFLYVNDAVLGFPGTWSHFYTNNGGTVDVEILMISEPASY